MAKKIEILVLLRETCDPRPPVRLAAEGAQIGQKSLRRMVNPADLCALEQALTLADGISARVRALALGPARQEDGLRLALSMGAHLALRVWDGSFEGADASAEARVLQRVCEILKPDLFFTGHRVLDRGSDAAPALAAARQGLPCMGAAVHLAFGDHSVEVLRRSDRGARQRIQSVMPCTVLFDEGCSEPRYPSQQAVWSALQASVECWGLAELGLPPGQSGEAGSLLEPGRYSFPRPNPVRLVTPDANLPAFERILALLSGGISPREGRVHQLGAEEAAKRLLGIFEAQGLIREARP